MNDLISRQAAIDEINNICPVDTEYDCTLLDRVDVRCVLSDLPSVQSERKKGKWTVTPLFIKCSECGEAFMLMPQNYCPNCGADMRGSNNEYEKIIGV